jgi:hypothetical protein
MKTFVAIAILFTASAVSAHAEPRWCSITGKGPNDNLLYPPIAKAAHWRGIVASRIIYAVNGKVEKVETVFGAPILATPTNNQLNRWTIKTDATGDELCQTLIIAKFRILDSTDAPKEPPMSTGASIYRILIETEPLVLDVVISDPAPLKGWQLFRMRVNSCFRHLFKTDSHQFAE